VEKDYGILNIYEVYEYQITQYSRETYEGGLFVDYINTILKPKAEASGYPSWVRSPEDEERYIQSFRESEVIELEKASIKHNDAKRDLVKLCLNSMWGNLTERSNRTQTKLISDPKVLYGFLATPVIEVVHVVFANEEVVWVSWKFTAEEHVPSLRHRGGKDTSVSAPRKTTRKGDLL
jgi:hypothetical protein